MSARFCILTLAVCLPGGCAWHYPVPVYPPFPPDHGYSAPYDPNQAPAPYIDDATLLQQPAPPVTGG
jgi:hypothetical protein